MAEAQFDVFLSYAHKDSSLAATFAKALEEKGLRVWYDKGQLRMGESIFRAIENGLEHSRCFLLLISQDYALHQWSNFEMGVALSRSVEGDRIVVPVFLGDVDLSALPPFIAQRQGFRLEDLSVDGIASQLAEVLKHDEVKHEA